MMVIKLIAEWEMAISTPELSKSRRATTISNHELILAAIDGTIGVVRKKIRLMCVKSVDKSHVSAFIE